MSCSLTRRLTAQACYWQERHDNEQGSQAGQFERQIRYNSNNEPADDIRKASIDTKGTNSEQTSTLFSSEHIPAVPCDGDLLQAFLSRSKIESTRDPSRNSTGRPNIQISLAWYTIYHCY